MLRPLLRPAPACQHWPATHWGEPRGQPGSNPKPRPRPLFLHRHRHLRLKRRRPPLSARLPRPFAPSFSTNPCARDNVITHEAAIWSSWPWSAPVPKSLPMATSTSMRRCADAPWPAPAATRMPVFSRPAWKPNWFPSPVCTALSKPAFQLNWHVSPPLSAWLAKATNHDSISPHWRSDKPIPTKPSEKSP